MVLRSIILGSALFLTQNVLLAHDGEFMEPPDGAAGILVGIGNNPAEATAWEAVAGMQTAVEKVYEVFDGLSAHLLDVNNLISKLNKMDAQGQIPQLSLYFSGFDPSFLPFDQSITLGYHDAFIDKLAAVCNGYGKPIFITPGYEFNLGGYTEYHFPAAFRYIVDRCRQVHDVTNVAWMWNPFVGGAVNTFLDKDAQGNYKWWPGAEYVNWIGVNGFNPTVWATKNPINTSSLAMIGLLDFADQQNKPAMILETSAKLLEDIKVTADPQAQAQANDLMLNHFGPLFTMLKCEPQMKGFIYLSSNWANTQWPTWGDHRMQNNQFLLTQYLAEITGPEYQNANTYNFPYPWTPCLIQKPSLGGPLNFDVHNVAPGKIAALFIAPALGTPVSIFPYNGTFQLAAPLFWVTTQVVGPTGKLRVSITIPNDPQFAGLQFESQFITNAGIPKPMHVAIQ